MGAKSEQPPPHRVKRVAPTAYSLPLYMSRSRIYEPLAALTAYRWAGFRRVRLNVRDCQPLRTARPNIRTLRVQRRPHRVGFLHGADGDFPNPVRACDADPRRRRLLLLNATEPPTAEWTARQLLEACGLEEGPRLCDSGSRPSLVTHTTVVGHRRTFGANLHPRDCVGAGVSGTSTARCC